MESICFVYCDHTAGTGTTPLGETISVAAITRMATAIDRQLNGEVADEWGGCCSWRIGLSDGSDVDPSKGEVEMAVFQHADVAGAAGYHAATPTGQPYGRLFLDECTGLFSGALSLSVIASHEGIELKLDPGANRYAVRADGITMDAIEGCDAVEDVTYTAGAEGDGAGENVPVSDFLLQSAFDPGAPAPYSYRDALASQYDTTPGGYRIVQKIAVDVSAAGHSLQATACFHTTFEKRTAFTSEQIKRKTHPASRTVRRGLNLSP
jgi:hypothetical protein